MNNNRTMTLSLDWVARLSSCVIALFALAGPFTRAQADCTPPPTGLVSWWQAEGDVTDALAVNNGSVQNGPTFVAGQVGQGFSFNGSSQYIRVLNSPSLNPSGSFSIEAWIYPVQSGIQTILGKWGGAGDYSGKLCYSFLMQPDNTLSFVISDLAHESDASFHAFGTPGPIPLNSWSHVAAVYDQSTGKRQIYVNAVKVAERTDAPITIYNTSNDAAIGARMASSTVPDNFFGGKIDELSYYNHALTTNEIAAIYNAGTAGKCKTPVGAKITQQPQSLSVTAGDSASFTVVATGTSPLHYQWQLNGTDVNGATGSVLSLSNVQNSDAGTYDVVVTNGYGSDTSSNATLTVAPVQCSTVPTGLVSWWQAEGNAADLSGPNSGVLMNGAGFASGEVGQAFSFNGANQYVTIPYKSSLSPTGSFTIEGWIYPTQSGTETILGKWGNIGDYAGTLCYTFLLMPANNLRFAISDLAHQGDASFHAFDTPANAVTLNTWSHVAAVYDQSTGKRQIYVNGVKLAERTDPPLTVLAANNNAAIGARLASSTVPDNLFAGKIDELSYYSRALTGTEIAGIYGARSAGKCTTAPPSITRQPQDRSATVGDNVSFDVLVTGSMPFHYQWQFNGTDMTDATNSSLSLTSVQLTDAGRYDVVVTNQYGSLTSSNATLTVAPPPQCVDAGRGLISWWRAEGNATDAVGLSSGNPQNGTGYAAGEVGQAFSFNGVNQYVLLAYNNMLSPVGSFSIEGWIYPTQSGTQTILGKWGNIGDYAGTLCYTFLMLPSNALRFAISDAAHQGDFSFHSFDTPNAITLNTWSHVAAVYNQSTGTRQIFINGVKVAERTDSPITILNATNNAAIGARMASSSTPDNLFGGQIDELSYYGIALSPSAVAGIYNAGKAGKCTSVVPFIVQQPTAQTITAGNDVSFSAVASGSSPLFYQWKFNGSDIADATNSVLNLVNVQSANAGTYSLVVTNGSGSDTSSNANLTVLPPPSLVQVVSATSTSSVAIVPINLIAQGTENAVGFSLQYDPSLLTFRDAGLGSGASGGSLISNTNQLPTGKVGIAISLPASSVFAAGTQQLVIINFDTAAPTNTKVANLVFGDQPIVRQVVDAHAVVLPSIFTGGQVTIPFLGYEADVSPMPNGDNAVTISDWVQVGRFVAGLDDINNGTQYQRADCAPRSTLGDGQITVSDWVQAGRYAAGLDPLVPAGGPTSPPGPVANGPHPLGLSQRALALGSTTVQSGLSCQVPVLLTSLGDENAVAFSVAFDPKAVSFAGASLGHHASGATLNINDKSAANGTVAFALAKPSSTTFSKGTNEVLRLQFAVSQSASGSSAVSFSSAPVTEEIASAEASPLAADYRNGLITLFSDAVTNPVIKVSRSGSSLVLSWPVAALGYQLEENPELTGSGWMAAPVTAVTNGPDVEVTVPLAGEQKFYRLRQR